jgi:hypothetical protein
MEMRSIKIGPHSYLLILKRDNEVIQSLKKFSEAKQIQYGKFIGLGAVNKVVLGYYQLDKKKYTTKLFDNNFEVISLVGNISKCSDTGEYIVHAHISLGDHDFKVFGGHLISANVTVTLECTIISFNENVLRKYDRYFNLKLLSQKINKS